MGRICAAVTAARTVGYDGAGTVTYGNADADGLHEVTCTHVGVIGYFAEGRRLYDAGRNSIV